MDELRVDVQVLYPTLFLHAFTARPEIDVALCKSYNRWIAKATEKSRGRLRWVAVVPLLNIEKAVEEVRWAKDHGACGVFKKGIECGDRAASDPYFFPVYDEASHLDLPICIHNATGKVESAIGLGSGLDGGMNAISAFSALAEHGIPDMFPKLRVGFIETGASWIPYLYADLEAKKTSPHVSSGRLQGRPVSQEPLLCRLPNQRRSSLYFKVRHRRQFDDRHRL
jgi:predicted TIM-barrel fold metal-dependent hydrolase